ncbi:MULTISPECIES: alpha/beta hydrolase [unclassified Leifsonia]|uniref:alpha/beta hydrolase n=1 Tax=unclassified Leifsonia TaxID=2663824 RepID=UPI000A18C0E4|nr:MULTISPECIES: alpha/beta hydrolase [unclassified Leifsonia]QIZ97575.1 alpha/beta hydrolase [Leifsonia sp. PS1209]
MTRAQEWSPDVLGEPFEQLTLPLKPDAEGEVVATLVRYAPPPHLADLRLLRAVAADADVLYVHGWSDYFFQKELARFWHENGARFFAIDLRKYGRSLRPWQTPGFVDDLATYDEELDAAISVIRESAQKDRKLILLGHSTGGLTLSLWADRHPGKADALVLNSPWLEFQAHSAGRAALAPLIGLQARVDPKAPLPNVDLGFYTRTVSSTMEGEWDYNLDWRPVRGFAVLPAWLTAVMAGHARVAAGLHIDVPVLTMVSARSTILPRWTPDMMSSDIVLVVDEIAQRALKLAPTVTVSRIDGAIHDIFLSREPVRQAAYAEVRRWLRGYLR